MMNKFLSLIKTQDPVTIATTIPNLLIALIITIYLALNTQNLPPHLPLLYSMPWGESQLATPAQLAIIPGIIILVTLINALMSWHLHNSQLVLKRLLSITSLFVTISLLITFIKIISIFI